MTSQQLSVNVAVNSWRLGVESADKIFSNLAEDQLLRESHQERTASSIFGNI
jgi:hypothetical protein